MLIRFTCLSCEIDFDEDVDTNDIDIGLFPTCAECNDDENVIIAESSDYLNKIGDVEFEDED